jgi:serine/threonine-protein phosphatase PP1 catalytic subunit
VSGFVNYAKHFSAFSKTGRGLLMETDVGRSIYSKLMSIRGYGTMISADLERDELMWICDTCEPIFMAESTLLQLTAPLVICGDTHGHFPDLLRIFDRAGDPQTTRFLFLGDYVDRGRQSIETVSLLLLFKISYPDRIWLLRGNHECSYINRLYGFYDEVVGRHGAQMWRRFSELFNCLPIAATIDDHIFCVHGGLSPRLESLDQIRSLQRPLEVPEDGLLCDLLWADPDPDPAMEGWGQNDRGISVTFGLEKVDDFCGKFGFDLICRGHQAVMEGYDFPFSEQRIVTIFSAPNYCYEYHNKGAFLTVDENLFCVFQQLDPIDFPTLDSTDRAGTPPRSSPGGEAVANFVVQGSPHAHQSTLDECEGSTFT